MAWWYTNIGDISFMYLFMVEVYEAQPECISE